MFSQFLHRPALAIVISIIILFLGGLSIKTLPISQFPSVAPPSVVVTVAFPGASANVLVDSVLVILEQREGIIVMQAMTSMLMYVNIYSDDKDHDQNFLYNYTFVNLLPEIKRVRGIGSA